MIWGFIILLQQAVIVVLLGMIRSNKIEETEETEQAVWRREHF